MRRLVTHDGFWGPEPNREELPVSWGSDEFPRISNVFYDDAHTNAELWREQVEQAARPVSVWEQIKFAGAIYARAIETQPLPMAEWPEIGRGVYQQNLQHGSVIAGNIYNNATHDRYGPFRDPRMSQTALDMYLASAMPREVEWLNRGTQVGVGTYTRGYGAPGG